MNKWISMLSIILVLSLSSLACSVTINRGESNQVTGSGNVIQEERQLSGVTSVRVANQGDLQIELGDQEKLVIEAEDNLMDYIQSDVRGGTLTLDTQNLVNLNNMKPIRYLLTVKSLDGAGISSSGSISAPVLQSDSFSIESSSSGDIYLEGLTAGSLSARLSSSGDVTIGSGMVGKQTVRISSSGNYDAQSMQSQEAEIQISSSGNASVAVSEALNGRISSSGNVYYWGEPQVNVSTSSSGEVIKQD